MNQYIVKENNFKKKKLKIYLFGHGGRIMLNFCKNNKDIGYILINKFRGDMYDNYPIYWRNQSLNPKTLLDIIPELIIPNITSGNIPDVILCGSRGGQVILPTLLEYGYNYPAVVINGDIVTQYKLINKNFPENLKMVLLVGKKDYFNNYDSILKEAPKQPGIFIVRDPLMEHMPNPSRIYKMLPAMIQTAISGSSLPLFELKLKYKEFKNIEVYNII